MCDILRWDGALTRPCSRVSIITHTFFFTLTITSASSLSGFMSFVSWLPGGWYSVWTGEHLYLLRGLSYLSERMSGDSGREGGWRTRPELLRENNSGIMKLTHTQTQINTSRTSSLTVHSLILFLRSLNSGWYLTNCIRYDQCIRLPRYSPPPYVCLSVFQIKSDLSLAGD